MTDPARRAETYSVLARAQVSAGRSDEATATVRQALALTDLPRSGGPGCWPCWRCSSGPVPASWIRQTQTARQALTVAEEAGDAFATAHALTDLWLSHSIRRDHAAALDYIDQALRVLGDDPGYADLRSFALDDRIFTLQNLDRWPEAELTLRQAREFAQRSGSPDRTHLGQRRGAAVLARPVGRRAGRAEPAMRTRRPGSRIRFCASAGQRCWSTA